MPPSIRYVHPPPSPTRRAPRNVSISVVWPNRYICICCRGEALEYADGVVWCEECGHKLHPDQMMDRSRSNRWPTYVYNVRRSSQRPSKPPVADVDRRQRAASDNPPAHHDPSDRGTYPSVGPDETVAPVSGSGRDDSVDVSPSDLTSPDIELRSDEVPKWRNVQDPS